MRISNPDGWMVRKVLFELASAPTKSMKLSEIVSEIIPPTLTVAQIRYQRDKVAHCLRDLEVGGIVERVSTANVTDPRYVLTPRLPHS